MLFQGNQFLILAAIGSMLPMALGLPTLPGLTNGQSVELHGNDELLKRDPMFKATSKTKASTGPHYPPLTVVNPPPPSKFTFGEWDIGLTMSESRYIDALQVYIPGKREKAYKEQAASLKKELTSLKKTAAYNSLKTSSGDITNVVKLNQPNSEQSAWLAKKQEGIFAATLNDYGVTFQRPPNSNVQLQYTGFIPYTGPQ